jgi:ABC-type sulfate transport system permease component
MQILTVKSVIVSSLRLAPAIILLPNDGAIYLTFFVKIVDIMTSKKSTECCLLLAQYSTLICIAFSTIMTFYEVLKGYKFTISCIEDTGC